MIRCPKLKRWDLWDDLNFEIISRRVVPYRYIGEDGGKEGPFVQHCPCYSLHMLISAWSGPHYRLSFFIVRRLRVVFSFPCRICEAVCLYKISAGKRRGISQQPKGIQCLDFCLISVDLSRVSCWQASWGIRHVWHTQTTMGLLT